MITRDETFRKFGPILLEAAILALLEQNNELRRERSMPEITEQQFIDSLNNRFSELEPYNWMNLEV